MKQVFNVIQTKSLKCNRLFQRAELLPRGSRSSNTWWVASEHHPTSFTNDTPQEQTQLESEPRKKQLLLCGVTTCTTVHLLQSWPESQPESLSYPLTCQQQSRLTTAGGDTPGCPSSGYQGDCTTGSHRTPTTYGQDWEMQHIQLIHKQTNGDQNEEGEKT